MRARKPAQRGGRGKRVYSRSRRARPTSAYFHSGRFRQNPLRRPVRLAFRYRALGGARWPQRRHSPRQSFFSVVGGSSSINGMVYNRGQAADFNTWAQMGNRGWGFEELMPYFMRSERRFRPRRRPLSRAPRRASDHRYRLAQSSRRSLYFRCRGDGDTAHY